VQVRLTDDPVKVYSAAGAFLAGRPVEHNLVLSLLAARVARPEPGRYGWVAGGEGFAGIGGVIFQSPPTREAVITPMPRAAAVALAEAVARAWPDLPGVTGEAGAAAAFAGTAAQALCCPARPVEGQRLYRLAALVEPPAVPGAARRAGPGDRALVAGWLGAFQDEVGETNAPPGTHDETAGRLVAGGRLWLWDDAGTVRAMANASELEAGVGRIGPVYTPPEHRRRGSAAAVTAAAARSHLDAGAGVVLFTQLHTPTSNALYRRLGFEPVVEVTRYRFG
jgi:predicted GNAT family acetyltransferase